ncbi:MAG: diguanylate cyclase [Fibrobacteria bacterium]|nr:diguanylate cyclase [Fibrobacteria bacterium]
MKSKKPIEIAEDIFWLGIKNGEENLQCNPYLIKAGAENILIDPGSVLDFNEVSKNLQTLVPLSEITHIILSHQDPDLCSSLPMFERAGVNATFVTHWRTMVIIKYYGIISKAYHVNENNFLLQLNNGRELKFLHAPYLHFPGAILTFDEKTETLFTGDLFGAFTINSLNDDIYADEQYIESMKAFHEHYMPGNEHLRPIMENLLNMPIKLIAPQHGSIIKDKIRDSITALRELECGSFLNPIKKKIAESGGYTGICNKVLKRYYSIAGKETVISCFKSIDILINQETGSIEDFNCSGPELWNTVFDVIYATKGLSWITPVEIFVKDLCTQYDIQPPEIFNSLFMDMEKQSEQLGEQYRELKERSEKMEALIEKTQRELAQDSETKLYNSNFFNHTLKNEFETGIPVSALLFIHIDNLQNINLKYGNKTGNQILRNIAYLIKESIPKISLTARMEGAIIGIYLPGYEEKPTAALAEDIRLKVYESKANIETVSISIGTAHTAELKRSDILPEDPISVLLNLVSGRVRQAQQNGGNYVCATNPVETQKDSLGKVIVVDDDQMNTDVLKTILESMLLEVKVLHDGQAALEEIELYSPDIIISEIMLPKADGFLIREKMMAQSAHSNIPFIITSHVKNEETIERAAALKITRYFKKPYFLSEMVGVVKNNLGI